MFKASGRNSGKEVKLCNATETKVFSDALCFDRVAIV